MTWYLEIAPTGEVFPLPIDDNGRARMVFNITAWKERSDTFIQEVIHLLSGVGTYGTNIFIGPTAILPQGEGPFLVITETAGSPPGRWHNEVSNPYSRPSAQLAVRGVNYAVARAMALSAYAALIGVRNVDVTP
jgi:hypothetical protein